MTRTCGPRFLADKPLGIGPRDWQSYHCRRFTIILDTAETPTMNCSSTKTIAVTALCFCPPAAAVADPPGLKTLPIGSAAPDFRLPGVDGKTYSLSDFAGPRFSFVIFTCNHCPTAQAYEGRIARLQADYQDKGVALVAISPNNAAAVRLDELGFTDLGDSFEDMKIRAKDHNFTYPYLYDGETQSTARAYGVLATPQVYIFDGERKLRYVGRFDDAEIKAVKSHDAKNAVEALLAGKPVPVATTRVFGCSTKWAEKQADARKSLAQMGRRARLVSNRSTLPAWPNSPRTTPRSSQLVNLWATWCGPCVAELPELVTMNRMYRGRNFQFVTISLDDLAKREDALQVLKENHVAHEKLHLERRRPRQVRRGTRPRLAWPSPLHHLDRARRQNPLPQDRRDRPART